RRGMLRSLPSSLRRAGRDGVADRWSRGASNSISRSRTRPPRRFAPPLLDEEGNAFEFALLVEEGGTRQLSRRVVARRVELHQPLKNPTTPSLRATPPRRGGECFLPCPPR